MGTHWPLIDWLDPNIDHRLVATAVAIIEESQAEEEEPWTEP